MNWRYLASKLIPMPMHSTYTTQGQREHARWVQWRDHVWFHTRHPA